MEKIVVTGGNELFGEINIGGMKNSALPIIFSTILVGDECIIDNIPLVSDVFNALEILKEMGAHIEFIDKHKVLINTKYLSNEIKGFDKISKMRASSYLMGTMLARFHKALLPMPGGCNFGVRPIEQHLKGFMALGAYANEENGYISIEAKNSLKSTKITLDKISVGATINIVLASVFLDGTTVIENVAIEPHVDDVIQFLNQCGARIIRHNRSIYCEGVKKLHGIEYRIYPDMIESLTYMSFLGATRGDITLNGINYEHIKYVCDIYAKMGYKIYSSNESVRAVVDFKLIGASIITAPYPLFPTDLHPQFASLLCFTKNGGIIKEEIFPTRFAYVLELQKMGAIIKREANIAHIFPSKLCGAEVDATDLRAGASLVCSALGASGESTINNVNYIVRGYEDIVGKIASLGGKIKLLKGDTKMVVTKETIIGDVLDYNPETAQFFFEIGMHCLGCPHSRGEAIEDACRVHGTDADALVEKLNNFLSK